VPHSDYAVSETDPLPPAALELPPARAFRIGNVLVDPPLLQAPMAGFTNYAYRQILRKFGGVGLPATEMLSARGVLHRAARSQARVPPRREESCADADAAPSPEPERLWGVKDEPRPLAVQIWDNDPTVLAEVGARLAHEYRVSVVDINFGCPVRDVAEKAKSGSYLLRDPERIGRIVAAMVQACTPVPVTAKIRLGCSPDSINAGDVAAAVEAAGAAAVTVHGRTASQMFRGRSDWEAIAQVKNRLRHIPLIGNGDLTTPEAVVEAFRRYGIDGVMIGRAGLGRPWLFAQAAAALAGQPIPADPSLAEQRTLLLEHHRLLSERFGPDRATVLMRKFACCYARSIPGARAFRGHAAQAKTFAEFSEAVGRWFPAEP
jgi:tRNA-dihydrouridine synthase B